MADQNQDEPLVEQVTARCTERQKRAVQFLALLEDKPEADMLRPYLDELVRIADERRARVSNAA